MFDYCTQGNLRFLIVFLRCVGILRGFLHVGGAVGFQFRVRQIEVRLHRVIFRRGKFQVQAVGADVRRILKTDAARIERFVRNGQSEFARFGRRFANGERVFPALGFGLESHELHDDVVVAHFPAAAKATGAATFFTRFARLRFGGVPSAISTTMMLVTNFFIPCRSKSIEVRWLSDSVTTPKPYWKCLMYCPSASAFNGAPRIKAITSLLLWPEKCSESVCCEKKGRTGLAGSPH